MERVDEVQESDQHAEMWIGNEDEEATSAMSGEQHAREGAEEDPVPESDQASHRNNTGGEILIDQVSFARVV